MVAEEPDASAARVLIDPLEIDASAVSTLDLWRPSWTGRLVAFQMSHGGSESPQVQVINAGTGRITGSPIRPGRPTPIAWLTDDRGFYYVHGSATATTRQIRIHLLDDVPDTDSVVFETSLRQLSVMISSDGHWLVISCAPGAQGGNRLYLADLTNADPSTPQLKLVYDGSTNNTQALIKFGPRGVIYAITTSAAPGGRICCIDPEQPTYNAWRTVITASTGTVLTGCTTLVDPQDGQLRFLVSTTTPGQPSLTLYNTNGRRLSELPLPGPELSTLTNLSSAPGEPSQARFLCTGFTSPPRVYCLDLADSRIYLDSAGGGPAPIPADFEVRHISYTSDDGTEIPLYLVLPTAPRTTHGPRPAILSAYGGFGAFAAATYSPSTLAWVKAGGIYAIAGVRGGGEHGTGWHEAGRHRNKPNAFTDFAAAARWLHTHGWTTPHQLAIRGASHSGLMVAAAITRDPHLYAAGVCSDALTDMIRYPQLGLGSWWIDEFGDPHNPEDLQTLLSYSPYHNTRLGTAYPAVLLTTPLHDPRVGAAHTRKFAAALQYATASTNPVLLRTETQVGHGARAVSRLINLHADTLAFCAAHTNLTPVPPVNRPGMSGDSDVSLVARSRFV